MRLANFLASRQLLQRGSYGYRRTGPELSVPLVWLTLRSRTAVGKDVTLDVLVPERFSNLLHWTAQSHDLLPPFSLCFGLWEVLVGAEGLLRKIVRFFDAV